MVDVEWQKLEGKLISYRRTATTQASASVTRCLRLQALPHQQPHVGRKTVLGSSSFFLPYFLFQEEKGFGRDTFDCFCGPKGIKELQ